jgi:hypothetical protein
LAQLLMLVEKTADPSASLKITKGGAALLNMR